MGLRNRNSFDRRGNMHFVTTSVMNRDRIFTQGSKCNEVITDSLKHLLMEHQSDLIAYVIMPSHIHLLLSLKTGESISDFMRDFKKYTSTKIRKLLESGGHDEFVERLRSNAAGYKRQVFRLWIERFDDVIVISEKILKIKVNYIHYNPVKAGLVSKMEEWEYSSARNYINNDHSIIQINTSWESEFETGAERRQDISPDGTC